MTSFLLHTFGRLLHAASLFTTQLRKENRECSHTHTHSSICECVSLCNSLLQQPVLMSRCVDAPRRAASFVFYFGLCSWQLSSLAPPSLSLPHSTPPPPSGAVALFIAVLLQFVFVRKLHFSAFYISINFSSCAVAAFYAAILA